jgi:DNA-binding FrmR family transcriptional regulator
MIRIMDAADASARASRTAGGGEELRHRHRDDAEKRGLLRRLARVEGQVRGVARMVEDDRYCVDVLTQLAAVHQALRQVSRELLRGHMQHCVREAFASGEPGEGDRVSDELAELMFKFSR